MLKVGDIVRLDEPWLYDSAERGSVGIVVHAIGSVEGRMVKVWPINDEGIHRYASRFTKIGES